MVPEEGDLEDETAGNTDAGGGGSGRGGVEREERVGCVVGYEEFDEAVWGEGEEGVVGGVVVGRYLCRVESRMRDASE